MVKFLKLINKHKKLTLFVAGALIVVGTVSFLTSLKGQLMLAFLASAFLFASVVVGGFIYLKSRPKRSVVFKVNFQYKEPTPKIFTHQGPHKLHAKITATTTEHNESREVYEKVLDFEVRPRKGEDLLGWFKKQIEDEIDRGIRALLAQNPNQEIRTDSSFRTELEGWRKRDSKVVDADLEI